MEIHEWPEVEEPVCEACQAAFDEAIAEGLKKYQEQKDREDR